jgi:hypothetical protein
MLKAFVILVVLSVALSDDRIKIDLFAESECPDCIEIIKGVVKTALNTKDFDKICNFNFFPFGNAHESKNADGN